MRIKDITSRVQIHNLYVASTDIVYVRTRNFCVLHTESVFLCITYTESVLSKFGATGCAPAGAIFHNNSAFYFAWAEHLCFRVLST